MKRPARSGLRGGLVDQDVVGSRFQIQYDVAPVVLAGDGVNRIAELHEIRPVLAHDRDERRRRVEAAKVHRLRLG